MKETAFQQELMHSFRMLKPSWLTFKIPDMPRSRTTRFIPRKPCDIMVVGKTTLMLEAKILSKSRKKNGKMTGKSSWIVKKYNKEGKLSAGWKTLINQAESLNQVRDFDVKAYFVINLRGKFKDISDKKVILTYFLDPRIVLSGDYYTSTGFKMTPVQIHGAALGQLTYLKGGIWEIDNLLETYTTDEKGYII